MFKKYWDLLKMAVSGFIDDDALSHGAAIAYYTIFSIAPVLVIVIAIAGLFFGHDAAEGAIVDQLRGLMGQQAAEAMQTAVKSASSHGAGIVATVVGLGTLVLTASGVFSEMQSSLNIIWKAEPRTSAATRLVKARLLSLGLIMALGFLLLVSLVISAGLQAMGTWMGGFLPGWRILAEGLNLLISFSLIAVLFGAIYKILPDKKIDWRDVAIGGIATSVLFSIGKYLIGLYIGSSAIASSYGAAGALAVVLVWIYYSAQIFLFGAEFTKAYAEIHGSHAFDPARKTENVADLKGPASAPEKPPLSDGAQHPEISDLQDRLRAEQMPRP
jgi:membrane protein